MPCAVLKTPVSSGQHATRDADKISAAGVQVQLHVAGWYRRCWYDLAAAVATAAAHNNTLSEQPLFFLFALECHAPDALRIINKTQLLIQTNNLSVRDTQHMSTAQHSRGVRARRLLNLTPLCLFQGWQRLNLSTQETSTHAHHIQVHTQLPM